MDGPKLDRTRIVETAITIMQRDGIEAFTMRRLAAELSIRAPTLYWYFADRSAILHEAIKTIFADTVAAVPDYEAWQDWLRAFGRALWTTNKTFPFAIVLLQSAELNDGDVFQLVTDKLRERITVLDVDYALFMEAQSHIQALTVGWAVFRQSGIVGRLGETMDVERAIERAIDDVVLRCELRLTAV